MHSTRSQVGDPPAEFDWAANVLEQQRKEILSEFEERLREMKSPLLSGTKMNDLLRTQATTIIEDLARVLLGEATPTCQRSDRLSNVIGTTRAGKRVHPSESLRAGTELSEVILFAVVEKTPARISRRSLATLASLIQRSTMERVARASISYVEHLLAEVHESRTDERRRVSRELHDRVASSLVIAHHHLGLYETLKNVDLGQAEEKLRVAHGATQDALASSRELSTELRRSVTREGLEVALSNLLPAIVPKGVRASISVRGDESLMPSRVKDELFLIVREAVRNSITHSEARRIKIELSTAASQVEAAILDDGKGFDSQSENFTPGTGLESMRERARIIGGTFRFSSAPGAGTRIEVQIPIGQYR